MSRIDDMIQELCPNGVEFKRLSEVLEKNLGGGTPSKGMETYWNGDIPWASVGDLSIPGLTVTSTRNHITPEGLAKSSTNIIKQGDLLVAVKISPGRMKIAGMDLAINQDLRGLTLKPEMDAKFLAYYFQTINFVGNGTIVKAITSAFLERTKIPVPPIEVQREIVKILDTFSKLEAELEAELEARRKQYTFYREKIFKNADIVEVVPLESLVDIIQGFPFKSQEYADAGIRVIRISDVQKGFMSKKDLKFFPKDKFNGLDRYRLCENDLVLSLSGSVGRVAMLSNDDLPAALNQRVACLRPKSAAINPRFLFHYLNRDQFELDAIASTSGGTVRNLTSEWVRRYSIPLVDRREQDNIVEALDNLDALVNDLSIGLPAELTARRQQYEYYRDRLLTFQEAT
jgi:type I restriction enzyme S subunit